MKFRTDKMNLFKVVVVAILALPLILGPWAFSQQPVKITGQPISVTPTGVTTNAVLGGQIGITGKVDVSGSTIHETGMVNVTGAVDSSNSTNVTVNLPSGAAVSSLQTAGNNQLASILAQLLAGLAVTNSTSATSVAVTNATSTNLAVNVVTSALPSGAATSSLQTAGNNQLASIVSALAAGLGITNFPSLFPATQSTSPWIVSGQIGSTGTVAVAGSVLATNNPMRIFHLITGATTNTNVIKTSAGVLYFVHPMNVTSTAFNIHIFDRASQPVTNSTRLLQVQAAVLGSGGGLHSDYQPKGIPFSNGLAIATSLTSSETNLTAISANSGIDIGYE